VQSNATTVDLYLAELPADRRASIQVVRQVILSNLDQGYEEGMQYGMIGYYVPHSLYPSGYHCDPRQPVPFVCLASQKNYLSLYMMSVYGDSDLAKWFQAAWKKTGKKLDMGKSCIRFKRPEDLALDVIGEAISRQPVAKHIEFYEKAIATNKTTKRPVKKTVRKVTKKSEASTRKKLP
jgi:hypothetical protein